MKTDPFYNSDPFRKKAALSMEVTVMVRYKDGSVIAQPNITNPWPYILAMKKHPNVTSAWIKK